MSTKEQIYNIIDSFSDEQLTQVYTMIVSVKKNAWQWKCRWYILPSAL